MLATAGYGIGLKVGGATLDGWHMFGGNPGHNGPVVLAPTRATGAGPASAPIQST